MVLPAKSNIGIYSAECSLEAYCTNLGIKTISNIEDARLDKTDLLLSIQYDRIIPINKLNGARAYNIHFSALPRNRGCYPVVWSLREGDAHAGVTLHRMTQNIDDGPIVDTILTPIYESTTARELYDRSNTLAVEMAARHLPRLLCGKEPAETQQNYALATYHDRKSIDFTKLDIPYQTLTAADCSRLARSLIFPPLQLPTIDGQPIVACRSIPDCDAFQSGAESAPPSVGSVHRLSKDQILVGCRTGWLWAQLATDSIEAASEY
jgi:methionyl-tRNA formyltransferase